jgi:hypothetical protein
VFWTPQVQREGDGEAGVQIITGFKMHFGLINGGSMIALLQTYGFRSLHSSALQPAFVCWLLQLKAIIVSKPGCLKFVILTTTCRDITQICHLR